MGRTKLPARIRQLLPPEHREVRKRPKPETASLPPISEKRFQQQVLDLAKVLHWRTYHTWISLHSTGGFPDLVLVKRPRVIFAELKSESGVVSDAQGDWIADLTGCGVEVYVWRPSDWDQIERTLTR